MIESQTKNTGEIQFIESDSDSEMCQAVEDMVSEFKYGIRR